MEKKVSIKTLYLLLVISIGLIGLGVGSTYALFTASVGISNPISFTTNLSYDSSIIDTAQVIVPAGEIVTTTLNVYNNTDGTLNYVTWYVKQDDNIDVVCENAKSQGTLTGRNTSSVSVHVINNSNKSLTVNLGISSSKNDVVIGDNMTQIEDINVLSSATSAGTKFLDTSLEKTAISSINFVDNINVPSDITPEDVSKYTDGSILMWYGAANESGNVDVYIGSNKGKTYIEDASNLFNGLSNLTSINFDDVVDTSLATSMEAMFRDCSNLTTFDLVNFNTSRVTDMSFMFYQCIALTSLDLSTFNTSKVTDMRSMFYGCKKMVTIYVSDEWSTASVTASTNMFLNCISLIGELGTVYNSSYVDATYAHIDGGTLNPGYLTENEPYNNK